MRPKKLKQAKEEMTKKQIKKNYGLPYQGSKNKLAERIVALLPKATHLYDVFAGGCAVTHAALLSGKFKEVHANDITDSVTLFSDAINGDIAKYEPERFRSREDFFAEKDSSPFVRLVYSFGSNQRNYLYSKEIEPYKKAQHEMLYAATPNERRLKFKAVIRELERLGVISAPSKPFRAASVGAAGAKGNFDCERLQHIEKVRHIEEVKMRLRDLQHYERTKSIGALPTSGASFSNSGGGVK